MFLIINQTRKKVAITLSNKLFENCINTHFFIINTDCFFTKKFLKTAYFQAFLINLFYKKNQ